MIDGGKHIHHTFGVVQTPLELIWIKNCFFLLEKEKGSAFSSNSCLLRNRWYICILFSKCVISFFAVAGCTDCLLMAPIRIDLMCPPRRTCTFLLLCWTFHCPSIAAGARAKHTLGHLLIRRHPDWGHLKAQSKASSSQSKWARKLHLLN